MPAGCGIAGHHGTTPVSYPGSFLNWPGSPATSPTVARRRAPAPTFGLARTRAPLAGCRGVAVGGVRRGLGDQVGPLASAGFDYHDVAGRVSTVQGAVRDKAAVDRAMAGVQVVVHTAAALPLYTKRDILTTDVDGTRNVLQSAHEHGVERFIHISSTAVYGVPDHHPIKEDDPLQGVGVYGQAKSDAELTFLESRDRGMCVPPLRPAPLDGPVRRVSDSD